MWKNRLKVVNGLGKEDLVFIFFKTILGFCEIIHWLLFGDWKKTLILQNIFQYSHINTPNSSNKSYI